MKRSFLISEESELEAVVDQFIADFPSPVTVRMDAEMGAGKTTFINCFCRKKGIEESSSPTFSIVNEYRGNDGHTIYHFDLYRLILHLGFMDWIILIQSKLFLRILISAKSQNLIIMALFN